MAHMEAALHIWHIWRRLCTYGTYGAGFAHMAHMEPALHIWHVWSRASHLWSRGELHVKRMKVGSRMSTGLGDLTAWTGKRTFIRAPIAAAPWMMQSTPFAVAVRLRENMPFCHGASSAFPGDSTSAYVV